MSGRKFQGQKTETMRITFFSSFFGQNQVAFFWFQKSHLNKEKKEYLYDTMQTIIKKDVLNWETYSFFPLIKSFIFISNAKTKIGHCYFFPLKLCKILLLQFFFRFQWGSEKKFKTFLSLHAIFGLPED